MAGPPANPARLARLTRHQHMLLRLGEWIAYAECAGSLARRAARAAERKQHEKANQRFDAAALAAMSRIFARDAAQKVAADGLRWVAGAGGVGEDEMAAFENAMGLSRIHRAQSGLIGDMDYLADVVYHRATKRAPETAGVAVAAAGNM